MVKRYHTKGICCQQHGWGGVFGSGGHIGKVVLRMELIPVKCSILPRLLRVPSPAFRAPRSAYHPNFEKNMTYFLGQLYGTKENRPSGKGAVFTLSVAVKPGSTGVLVLRDRLYLGVDSPS